MIHSLSYAKVVFANAYPPLKDPPLRDICWLHSVVIFCSVAICTENSSDSTWVVFIVIIYPLRLGMATWHSPPFFVFIFWFITIRYMLVMNSIFDPSIQFRHRFPFDVDSGFASRFRRYTGAGTSTPPPRRRMHIMSWSTGRRWVRQQRCCRKELVACISEILHLNCNNIWFCRSEDNQDMKERSDCRIHFWDNLLAFGSRFVRIVKTEASLFNSDGRRQHFESFGVSLFRQKYTQFGSLFVPLREKQKPH